MKTYKMEDILKNAKIEIESTPKTPNMWKEVFKEIDTETPQPRKKFFHTLFEYKIQAAIGFAIVFLTMIMILDRINPHHLISVSRAEKLANNIDKKVFEAQKQYEEVIAEMEAHCPVSELTSQNDLAQAYFDKLHLLDQMILICKSSLEDNPYNSQIHRQLFFAYNEKIKVYKEMQNLKEREIS
ncbi:MAG: hypothetical protein JXQ65_12650 [Candidatus Marinimicrobia bacterium]|nr:hypothetical protein [Candidatus Neomarinimicrobiota bacterium]